MYVPFIITTTKIRLPVRTGSLIFIQIQNLILTDSVVLLQNTMDYIVPSLAILMILYTIGFWVYLELAAKKPLLPVIKKDLEEGSQETHKYTRNFTIEIMRDNKPIMNIDAELRHRVVWMKD